MAVYEYCCESHGVFDIRLPMSEATSSVACPMCGGESSRILSIPMVSRLPRGTSAAIDQSKASAEQPAVVSSLPSSRKNSPSFTYDPRHRRLPRR